MDRIGPAVLAFGLATFFVLLELITSQYSRNYFLLWRKSRALYVYGLVYGIISGFVFLAFDQLSLSKVVTISGIGLDNPWIRAIAIGLSAKALFHIRLFTSQVGSQPVPIGLETIVLAFEPWFLRTIELDSYNAISDYLAPRVQAHRNLDAVKKRMVDNIPGTFPETERRVIQADIMGSQSVKRAMELFLSFFGQKSLERLFPV